MLQHNAELKSKINQLWDKFWSGGISNPLTAIEQITYLLFMKRLDELDLKKQVDAEWTDESYKSKFEGKWVPPELRSTIPDNASELEKIEYRANDEKKHGIDRRDLRWSQFNKKPAEQMLQHVQTKVFPFLKDLNGTESNFTHHMKNAVFIIPKPSLLVEAVKTIDEIFVIMEKDAEQGQNFQDIQGDVYEFLLSEIASAGKNGQFRTPRHIIKLLAELVQPQLGDKICDPACGTGGFLLGGYQYVVTQLALKAGTKDLIPDEDGFIRTSVASTLTPDAQAILDTSLFGFDIDGTMVRLGLMNLMMHGISEPQIDYKDTLSKTFEEEGKYNVIMANPPFTGNVDKGDINERFQSGTTKSELLFMENIYHLLKKGGTAGVIIPQGVLFGSGKAFQFVRKLLIERCDFKAVITMPSGVFKPYAGVSTAILIFTKVWGPKDKISKPATENVWFYDMVDDGYSLDDKRNKKDSFGDLQDIITKYHSRHEQRNDGKSKSDKWDRTKKHFCVPFNEIEKEGYDLSYGRYKEDTYEDVDYESPTLIVERLIQSEVGQMKDVDLIKIESGVVRELLDLQEMIK
ncbi:N-6 DNA methylase [Vibrio vulnificus]|nr:N-6 DNA methylase [Vibrio vulnificus]EIA1338973.1 N-6 DNA methylase [Vibrio vulnificus]EIA1773212.1 N-6 DNA methylase [Vibrio vulnificus]EJE8688372.1 N-6 DNA methylase [Vibrio vulnificus]CAH8190816.1 Type I restriction-modification system, DNA-methyltransferase subunit M [Vibrio aestuarianus]